MKSCPFCAEEIQDEAVKCKHCGEFLNVPPSTVPPGTPSVERRLTRSTTDSMLGGVCGGVAQYSDLDPTIVRVVTALAIFFTGIIPGMIAYFVVVAIVPKA